MEKQTITIYDVAREAGVSMATVSRVVNGNPNVKPSTRKKVSEVIDRLNYRPNAVARGLASKKTTTIGVIIPSVTNLFFASLARGIDDIASMYKYNIILANADESEEKEIQVFNTLLAKQVDGIIFMGYEVTERMRNEIERTNTPVVFAGTKAIDESHFSVNIDWEAATKDAFDGLLENHQRVSLITGPSEYVINQQRISGYKQALAEHNIDFDEDLMIQTSLSFQEAGAVLADELKELDVTAAVVAQDDIAGALLNSLQDNGLTLPEDFELVSSHNTMVTELVRPQLSSIEIPLYDIGAVAMRLLTKVMNKEEIEEKQVILPHKFKVRGSTRS